jgi:hypothetical protein
MRGYSRVRVRNEWGGCADINNDTSEWVVEGTWACRLVNMRASAPAASISGVIPAGPP